MINIDSTIADGGIQRLTLPRRQDKVLLSANLIENSEKVG